jgi:UDP-N-acetylmuramoyl-L-alanyl-D-glutamate--2,6-diaminopimelate ligase
VRQGDLFVALVGVHTDGHHYIPDAIRNGAMAIVGSQDIQGLAVPYFKVQDSRLAMAILAAAMNGFPARRMTMLGVTGTDGKTTTSNLIFHILRSAGLKVGMITTVNAIIGNRSLETGFHVTTPEAPDIQNYLAQMVTAGLNYAVLEATSHGLDQQRVAACDFDIGVITNITHEHLDYHGTFAAYRSAKARLFTSLSESPVKQSNPPRGAVLNLDDASYPFLSELTRVPQISYGLSEEADFSARDILVKSGGVNFTLVGKDPAGKLFSLLVETQLNGMFNVSNCLAAFAVSIGIMGLDPESTLRAIANFPGVAGRMERIDLDEYPGVQEIIAMVDFAHTPNALRRALESVRSATTGRVIAVFGSAGLRDREKRRMMAEISVQLADVSIFTAEDPRTESLEKIIMEMASGARVQGAVEGEDFYCIPDRREAIRFAVRIAKKGELVIACGKGHEQSMCFGEMEYPWDDRLAMRAALAEIYRLPGPEMPYLPDAFLKISRTF